MFFSLLVVNRISPAWLTEARAKLLGGLKEKGEIRAQRVSCKNTTTWSTAKSAVEQACCHHTQSKPELALEWF